MKFLLVLFFLISCLPSNKRYKTNLSGSGTTNTDDLTSGLPALPDDPLEESQEFQQIRTVVLDDTCVDCHAANSVNTPWAALSEQQWVSSGLIIPGQPQNSEIIRLLTSANDNEVMPKVNLNYERLPLKTIDMFRDWILLRGGINKSFQDLRRESMIDVIASQCVGCHTNGGNSGGLNFNNVNGVDLLNKVLATDNNWKALTVGNVPGFVPENPNNSPFFLRLRGSGGGNPNMPIGNPVVNNPFDNTELNVIRDWILGLD